MFSTTFNSETVYVLNDSPNWASQVGADFKLSRDTQAGLTNREARRPYQSTLLTVLKYTAVVQESGLRALQGALRSLTTESVIVPFWPARCEWADRASNGIQGGLMIAWKADWSQFEVYTAADDEPTWPADGDYFAPALMGFLASNQPKLLTSDAAEWQVEFTESSPAAYALQPAAITLTDGPQPTGYDAAPPLLPFHPDFTESREGIKVEVSRDEIGFGREQAQTFYPHNAFRSQRSRYTLNVGEDAKFLRFFQDVAAPGASFWAPGWLRVAKLTANALSTDTVLHVEDTDGVSSGDYLFLYGGGSVVKVLSKTSTTLTLTAAVGVALTTFDGIFPIALARLNKPSISVNWLAVGIANVVIEWTEVTAEVLVPDDETVGETLGKLPLRVVLFEFSRDYRNGTVDKWYFTNFEQDIEYDSKTWLARSIRHGEIVQSLNVEESGCKIETFLFDGNPLIEDVLRRAEAPLSVIIRHADVTL